MEVIFTVLPAIILIEKTILKRPKTLCTHKTLLVINLTAGVDHALFFSKAIMANKA